MTSFWGFLWGIRVLGEARFVKETLSGAAIKLWSIAGEGGHEGLGRDGARLKTWRRSDSPDCSEALFRVRCFFCLHRRVAFGIIFAFSKHILLHRHTTPPLHEHCSGGFFLCRFACLVCGKSDVRRLT